LRGEERSASKRSASAAASARIHKYSRQTSDRTTISDTKSNNGEEDGDYFKGNEDYEEGEDDENEEEEEEEEEEENGEGERSDEEGGDETTQTTGLSVWKCSSCNSKNEARARSCAVCMERKPAADMIRKAAPAATAGKRGGRELGKRKKRRCRTADDDDGSDEAEFDEEDGGRSRRAGARRLSRGLDTDDDEDSTAKRSLRTKARGRSYAEFSSSDFETENVTKATKRKRTIDVVDEDYAYAEYVRNLPVIVQRYEERIRVSNASSVCVKSLLILKQLLADPRSQPFWEPVDLELVPSYRYHSTLTISV
jgi:hypothetical protein